MKKVLLCEVERQIDASSYGSNSSGFYNVDDEFIQKGLGDVLPRRSPSTRKLKATKSGTYNIMTTGKILPI